MLIFFLSLGCDKNLVDSEVMLSLINKEGFEITNDEAAADIIIINTCGFIADATQESINNILEMAQYKTIGKCKALIVTGCMVQRYRDEIFNQLPEIDAIVGINDYHEIVDIIKKVNVGEKNISLVSESSQNMVNTERILSTPSYFAYLKIAEGCDNACTYCTIPSIRGKYKSRTIESLVSEAQKLASYGIKELILVAQDTGYYGKDIYGEFKLHALLRELSNIEGIEWIRILYCYPERINSDLIDEMAKNPKVCHYIDIPIQHADNDILKLMGRKHCNKEKIVEVINALRSAMPNISIRTTLIVGFPKETEQNFNNLLNFVNQMQFEKLGVFTYSKEEGTPAYNLPEQVDEEVKEQRKEQVMLLQKNISFEKNKQKVGKTLKIIVDGFLPEQNVYCGRSYADCYEIDCIVFFESEYEIVAGEFVNVLIEDVSEYDLFGSVV